MDDRSDGQRLEAQKRDPQAGTDPQLTARGGKYVYCGTDGNNVGNARQNQLEGLEKPQRRFLNV